VIAPNLRVLPAVAAVAAAAAEVVLEANLARNAIAAAKLAILHVHAPRHQEVAREAMEVVVEVEVEVEGTAVLVAAVVVKKHGAHSFRLVSSPGTWLLNPSFDFWKLHMRRGRPSVA
jgi:hypothetical protein